MACATRLVVLLLALVANTISLYSPMRGGGTAPRPYAGRGGRGGRGSRGGRGGRGGRSARGGGGWSSRGRETEDERRADLFGAPGEWRTRSGRPGEFRNWQNAREELEGSDYNMAANADDELPPVDFAPKTWSAESGGGKPASFFAKAPSFAEIGASDELQAALRDCALSRPSHVQAVGFGPMLAGDDVVLADQTGSGKTVAYLAPLVQLLRDAEQSSGRTADGHVRAIVLTPTSELAQQVLSVAKRLAAGGAPFRSSIITGEHKWRTQAKCAERGLELLVCTPGRLRAHLLAEPAPTFSLASCQRVVLDEAVTDS